MFKNLAGRDWYSDAETYIDNENKITEFDYENYFNPILIQNRDLVESKDFKKLVKVLNLFSHTRHEALQKQKEDFKDIMPILRGLSDQEIEVLLHKMRNTNRKLGDDLTDELFTTQAFQEIEERLAKISEDANYDAKNRYRLQKTTLDYADKKRMPIDESKIRDVLRNRPTFRNKIEEEIGNYENIKSNPQFEYGILTYLNEATMGEMRDLVRDVGIHTDNMEFFNVGDLQKKREQLFVHQSDHNFGYLMNALFTPLDMTDYENSFVGFDEVAGTLPLKDVHLLKPVIEEPHPANHALAALETIENRPQYARSRIHRELLETKAAEAEAEAEEEEEEEEGEEEGEEGEEGEEAEGEGEEEAGEEEEEEEEEVWPPEDNIMHVPMEDKYFIHGENLRNKFNEVELDSFMKLLNVKPYKQWQDTTVHHYKLGAHTYEDDSQQLDHHFHILGEVERKHAERYQVEEFRRGTEVKFSISEKRPAHYNYRF